MSLSASPRLSCVLAPVFSGMGAALHPVIGTRVTQNLSNALNICILAHLELIVSELKPNNTRGNFAQAKGEGDELCQGSPLAAVFSAGGKP